MTGAGALVYAASPGCGARMSGSCNDHSVAVAVAGYVVLGLIVALVIFDLAWKFTAGGPGPISRAFLRVMGAVSRGLSSRRR